MIPGCCVDPETWLPERVTVEVDGFTDRRTPAPPLEAILSDRSSLSSLTLHNVA
jgi:hypothetical protein